MIGLDAPLPTLPAFALRFERGRARLVLSKPFAFYAGPPHHEIEIGRVEELVLDLGAARGVRLHGSWASLRGERSELVSATIDCDVAALASLARKSLVVEAASHAGARVRIVEAEGHVVVVDVLATTHGEDVALTIASPRSTGHRAPTLVAAVADALATSGATFDANLGAWRVARVLRRVLTEALVPLGMRIPETRGAALAEVGLVTGARVTGASGTLHVRLQTGAHDASREHGEHVARELEARMLGPTFAALIEGRIDDAMREFGKVEARLGAASRSAWRTTLELEHDDRSGADGRASTLPWLRQLAAAVGAECSSQRSDDVLAAWQRSEPSTTFAGAVLVQLARTLRASSPERSRALALRALETFARAAPRDDDPFVIALAALAIEVAGDALDASHAERWLGPIETNLDERHGHAALVLALLLEAAGRHVEAGRAFARAATLDEPLVAAALAEREERRGEALRALEAWDRTASLAQASRSSVLVRRASLRAARIALTLGLDEVAAVRIDRALDAAGALDGRDVLSLVGAVGRSKQAELITRVEELVLRALPASGEASSELVAALEQLLEGAIERQARPRAAALLEGLQRARPDRAELYVLPDEVRPAEDPRRRAERLRAEGHDAEAAAVLAELGLADRDAATLRAALDLAERAAAHDTARTILDALLEWVGPGPVADGLRRRRARLPS